MKKYFNVSFFARIILGGIFIYAAIYKLLNPQLFEKVLSNYGFFPHVLIRFIVISVPLAELILGALLISGILSRYAALATIILLLIFIVLTVLGTLKGNSKCGCFPESSFLNSNNPFILLIRNFLLLLLAVVIITSKTGLKSKPLLSENIHFASLALALFITFCVSLLFVLIAKRAYEN